jgi:hypothetical protein
MNREESAAPGEARILLLAPGKSEGFRKNGRSETRLKGFLLLISWFSSGWIERRNRTGVFPIKGGGGLLPS